MDGIGICCAVALCGSFLALLLKKQVPEYAFLTAAACGVLLFLRGAEWLSDSLQRLRELVRFLPSGAELVEPLWKAGGITVLTRLTAAFCKDAGQSALGEKVELLGAAACLLTALPLVEAVLQLIGGML